MKRRHDPSGLMKFAAQTDWADHLRDALDDHLGPAMEAFDLEPEDLADIIGDHWASALWGCAFEDLATRTVGPEGRNLANDYLKRRGGTEAGPTKLYIRALRASVMSLYEVSEVEPGAGFLARDLLRGGDPAAISERSASQTLQAWDRIGARVVLVGNKRMLTGGLLSFTAEAAEALIAGLRQAEGKGRARGNGPVGDERLRELAPLISTTWLFDTIPRALGPAPTLHNSDGEEVVFHRVRFSFVRGATQALISARLDAIPALQRENARFWNWLGERSVTPQATGRLAWGVTMEDGTPVLGNVELKGRAVILAVTSAGRAERGIALLTEALGDRVGSPLTEIETVDQAMAARRETPAEPDPSRPRPRPHSSTPCSIVTIALRSMSLSQCWATSLRARPPGRRQAATGSPHGSSISRTVAVVTRTRPIRWRPTSLPGCGANSESKTCVGDAATVNPCPDNVRRPLHGMRPETGVCGKGAELNTKAAAIRICRSG